MNKQRKEDFDYYLCRLEEEFLLSLERIENLEEAIFSHKEGSLSNELLWALLHDE